MSPTQIQVTYFSDLLCIWAYIAEQRLEELKRQFGDTIAIDYRYISVFGDTISKIGNGWESRGGFDGYAKHVHSVAEKFDHIKVHPDVWKVTRPISSQGPHSFLKAIQLWQSSEPAEARAKVALVASEFRRCFFEDAMDISDPDVQIMILESAQLPVGEILQLLKSGQAFAALHQDADLQAKHHIHGSPTFVFNQGRQILYGNVGFKIIEANINELLRRPDAEYASWC
jgi:predicted DsbA family dithiol-disulfide isomerase